MELTDILATNVWKLFPFKSGNRVWIAVLLKAYFCCVIVGFCLACILNAVEGDKWLKTSIRPGHGPNAKGDTALDECFWFVFTTMHGVGFGEFMARGVTGRLIAMFCCTLYYWFTIFVMAIIMLSQLPGERVPSLLSVASRMVCALWPSYSAFLGVVLAIGSVVGPYISRDHEGKNEWPTGMYWAWTTVHRTPYGDLYPDTVFGRTVTVPIACISVLYMPYALACIAIRSPNLAQHREIIKNLRENADDALGRGYVQPPGASGNGSLQEFVNDDGYVQEGGDDDDDHATRGKCCIVACCMLTFVLIATTFFGSSPKAVTETIVAQVEHGLELDLPPGIRNAENPVPEVVWTFHMQKTPLGEKETAALEDMKEKLDIDVQVITEDTLILYNVTEDPFHPAMKYLAPNHKLDYLHAYFMHHYGGGYMEKIEKRKKKAGAWTGPITYLRSNETFWLLGKTAKENPVPCDESNIAEAWCKELQFKSDFTYADTKQGLKSWDPSQGPCCGKVQQYYNGNVTSKSGQWMQKDAWIMRKETPFTEDWLKLVNAHLTAKLPELKKHKAPSEPCCVNHKDNYPLRWEELRGEIWSVLIMKYSKHMKFAWKDFFGVDLNLQ